ncbi:MAG: septal ring lytic transglycosylase RlpA family protein [Salinivirgaceae bacterium]|jgi:rare lipoprotein A|nr:septal ring lytic transglycosylase RlpA family protein [Salinivirgaceae bacterium]
MKKIIILLALCFPLAMLGQKQIQHGKASFYADKFEGRTTASGEKYWHSKLTAAHKNLPFGTEVRVTNLENNETVIVRINDRGPFVQDRIIDLSKSAAKKLDFIKRGVCNVKVEVVSEGTVQEKNTEPIVKEAGSGVISNAKGDPVSMKPQFYSLTVSNSRPLGYGLQLASYKEMINLLERVKGIQETLREEITIQVSSVNGEKVYRIIAGQFDSRSKAERYKEKIRDSFPGCFIFKY